MASVLRAAGPGTGPAGRRRYARGVGELLNHFVEDPRVCDYLADQRAALEYRVMTGVDPEELESLLVRGWRRLGPFYCRPACSGCFECVPLRIPVASFAPSGSQQRAARRADRKS